MMHRTRLFIVIFVVSATIGSCSKHYPDQPTPPQSPSTRLWIIADTTMKESVSRQHLYWWGEDPDGYVVGYLLAYGKYTFPQNRLPKPDTLSYLWMTRSDTTILLPLDTLRARFSVIVRAADNRFMNNAFLPSGVHVRLTPQPFWDRDSNGTFDPSDIPISGLAESLDPVGAVQVFPIRNTPPRIQFAANPVDSSTIEQPELTYTVATFSWIGTDDDGDNTITSYRIALNDSTLNSGFVLTSATKMVTIAVSRSVSDLSTGIVAADVYTGIYPSLQHKGKINGLRLDTNNVFYVQARDVAGEYSQPARLPSSKTRSWYVRKPKSRMLVVADFLDLSVTEKNKAINTYRGALSDNSILGGTLKNFDLYDVGTGLTPGEKQTQTANQKYGKYVPANINPAFILTLKLYDVVFWFSDLYPSYIPAQIGLFNYSHPPATGKVIFSTTFPASVSFPDVRALNDFSPIDSVTTDATSSRTLHTNADGLIPAGTRVLSMISGYPELAFDSSLAIHSVNLRKIYNNANSVPLYRLDSSRFYQAQPPPPNDTVFRYLGRPEVACIDNNKQFVLVALPLHVLNGRQKNLPSFFKKVIVDEFGLK